MCGGVTEERSMVVGGDVCRRGSEGEEHGGGDSEREC